MIAAATSFIRIHRSDCADQSACTRSLSSKRAPGEGFVSVSCTHHSPSRLDPAKLPSPRSAYIHIPFCRHHCGYCDFAVVAGRDDLVEPFFKALHIELSWLGQPRPVDTLYFGGGTPTELSEQQLGRLCDAVLAWHPLNDGHEWTVEANPESLTDARMRTLAERGATRVSLGVQSFNAAKLRVLERGHTAADVFRCVDSSRQAGLAVAIDLMFAAPGETLDDWRRDVQTALSLEPDHVSTYGMTWEPRTAFAARRSRGELHAQDEEAERAMYAEAIDALTAAGYEHYEVSNFARPRCRSRHNEVYWAGREYFAAGPGAARYIEGVRETNCRSTTAYIKRVLNGESPVADRERLTDEGRAREQLVLGLRRLEGIERRQFADETGFAVDALIERPLARFTQLGLLSDDGSRIRLSLEGLYVSDALWPDLL
jgi:oxygen-independent coproporphyrinogen-3 oxidase